MWGLEIHTKQPFASVRATSVQGADFARFLYGHEVGRAFEWGRAPETDGGRQGEREFNQLRP